MARISKYTSDSTVQKTDKFIGSNSDGTTANFSVDDIARFFRETNFVGNPDQVTYKYVAGSQASGQLDAPSVTNFETTSTRTIRFSVYSHGNTLDTRADFLETFSGRTTLLINVDDPNNFLVAKVTNIATSGDFKTFTFAAPETGKGSFISGKVYAFMLHPSSPGDITAVTSATTNQLTVANGTGPEPALTIVTGAISNGGTGLATADQIHTFVTGQTDTIAAATTGNAATATKIASITNSDIVQLTSSQTLTNKILTSPVFNTGISGTAIKDEDNMSSDSATHLATQQSIKAYVDSQILTKDNTDEITEGSSNLYFTNERVDDRVNSLLTAGSNITLTYDDAGNALTIAATQLTNEQVQDVIGGMLGGDETGGVAVTYDDANNHIDFALSSIPNSSLANSSVTINSNSLALGGTLTLDTGDIGEGSNLYFTNERVDDRVNALVTAGTGITSTYDDAAGTLTLATTITQYTDALARGAISVSGNALSYNSSTGVITSNFEETPTFTGVVTAVGFANSTGNLVIDSAEDIHLDVDGGDVILKDDGTQFGTFTHASGPDLVIKSGTTTMLAFSAGQTKSVFTGEIEAGSLDISGDADIDGTLETDALTIGGVTSVPFEAADHSKLDGIEASATADQSNAEIRTAVEAASDSNVFTDADHSKLNAIEASATADQTDAEIRTAVEAATDSNVFTDADHTKLNAIEASADVTDTTNVTAAGALMDSELTDLAAVKAINQGLTTSSNVSFGNITTTGYLRGPASFTIDPAAHGDNTGTLVIAGNLQVDGTTTTINSTTVAIDDLNFSIATDAADSAAANGAGITIGGAGATLTYAHADTSWNFNKPLNVTGTITGTSATLTTSGTVLSLDRTGGSTALIELKLGGTVEGYLGATTAKSLVVYNESAAEKFSISNAGVGTFAGTVTWSGGGSANANTAYTYSQVGHLPLAGGTMTGTVTFNDGAEVRLGNDNDMGLFSSSGVSHIRVNEGTFVLRANDLSLKNKANDETYLTAVDDGAVSIYYDNSKKFETTSAGIDVTGNIVVSGTVDGVDIAARDAVLTSTTTTANAALPKAGGTMTGDIILGDNVKLELGAASGGDLQIYHDGSDSIIADAGTGGLKIQVAGTGTSGFYKYNTTEVIALFEPDGPVSLYHNNSKKFETTSYGTNTSGRGTIVDTTNPGGDGTASGGGVLTVEGRRDGTANVLTLRARDESAPAVALPDGQGGIVRWQGFDGTDFAQMGAIAVVADGQAVANSDAPSKMVFYTTADGSETLTTALTLDKSQNATFAGDVTAGALTSGATAQLVINHEGGASAVAKFMSRTNRAFVQVGDNDTNGYLVAEGGLLSIGRAASASSNNINIDASHRVGIGTTSPSTKTHISHTTKINDAYGLLLVENTNTTSGNASTNSGINVKNYHGTSQFMQWEENGLRIGSRITANSGAGDVIFTAGSDSEKMRITSAGNLQMAGTGTDNDSYAINFKNGACAIARDSNDLELHAYDNMVFGVSNTSYPTSTERMRISSTGLTTIKRTGITGVTKNDMTLQIGYEGNNGQNNLIGFGYNAGNAIPAYIGYTTTSGSSNTKGAIVFGTRDVVTDSDPTERMRIQSNGNVGIGTNAPNFKLDLVNASASTAVYQQFRNGTTGTASGDGTVMGIDADGDFLINNQEAKEIKFYTSDAGPRLTIAAGGAATFAGTITAAGGSTNNNDDANILTLNASQHARLLVDTSSTSGHRATLALESNGNELTLSNTGSASELTSVGNLTVTSSTTTFAGDIQAPGIYVGSTNTSYDFYNNGTSYLNGATTVDAAFTQTGNAASSFSGGLVVNEGSNDADFRVESNGEAYMLRVDGGNNRFGVATQNPSTTFHVTGDSTFAGDVIVKNTSPAIQLYNTDDSLANDQTLGDLEWYQVDPSDQGVGVVARIRGINGGSTAGAGDIEFQTGTATSLATRLAISYTGAATFAGEVNITSTGAAHFSITNSALSGGGTQYWGQYVGSNADYTFRDFTDSRSTLVLHGDGNATFAGTVTWSGGGSANANTAYTYSQVGHLPLAGGTMTGDLIVNSEHLILKSSSPELYFYTTNNHVNWLVAAQESTNACLEFSAIAASTSLDQDASNYSAVLKLFQSGNATFAGDVTTTGSTITVDPASGDAELYLQSSSQTLRFDQNSIRTMTDSDLNLFTKDNTNQLFLDQGTGRVGLGTTSPLGILSVRGAGDAIRVESENTGAGGAQIDLLHFTTSPADEDTHAVINMGGYYTGTTSVYGTQIKSIWTDVSERHSRLEFTTCDTTVSTALTLAHDNTATFAGKIRAASTDTAYFQSSHAAGNYNYFGSAESLVPSFGDNDDLGIYSSGKVGIWAGAGDVSLTIEENNNATFAGNITVSGVSSTLNTGNSGTFVTNDANNYPRITTTNSNAQLGLFRSGSSAGGMYIGANSGGLQILTSSFSSKFSLDTSGNGTFAGTNKATAFLVNRTTAAGVGASLGDINGAELGPGYLSLARDDTADAKQIVFEKNDGEHSYLQTASDGLEFGGNAIHFSTDSTFLSNYNYTFRDAVGITNPNATSAATNSNTVMSIGARSGGTVNTSLITTGAVGIGHAAPTSRIDVREDANNVYTGYFYNSSTAANAHGINVQTATTNAGAYAFRVNSASNANALVVMGNARVGIGTSTPDMPLDVAGNIRSRVASNTAGGFYIGEGHTAEAFGLLSQGANGYFKIRDEYNNADRFYIENDGKVGIGTIVAPHQKLTVTGSSGAADGNLTAGILALTTGTGVIADTRLLFGIVDDDYAWIQAADYGVAYRDLILSPNGGNVGIGVTSPGNKLTIASGTGGGSAPDSRTLLHIDKNGEAYISINSPAESFNGIRLNVAGTPKAFMELYDNTAQGKKLNIGTVDARDLVFDTGNQPKMVILSGGNVGIGTTLPEAKLHIFTADASIAPNADGDELVVENSGNAGISILSGNTSNGALFFGDAQDSNVGIIDYDHNTNAMSFTTGASTALTINASQNATFGGHIAVASDKQIQVGNSISAGDLKIYRDTSSNTQQILNKTGTLKINQQQNDGNIVFTNDDGAGGSFDYFYLDGGSATYASSATTAAYTVWLDNSRIALGSGKDLQLWHDGTTSTIYNSTGNLHITCATDDSDIRFYGHDGSSGVTEYFRIDGGDNINYFSKHIKVPDSVKMYLGSSQDLQIYHDGSNSYIKDGNASSDLIIQSNHILLQAPSGENMIFCNEDAEVKLYYNNSAKLQTTDAGATILGSLSVTGDGQPALSVTGGISCGLDLVIAQNSQLQASRNTTTDSVAAAAVSLIDHNTGSGNRATMTMEANSYQGAKHIEFYQGSTVHGSISAGNNAVGYNTSSDYRLKENINDLSDALTKVDLLSPKTFTWKGGNDTVVQGFLAHEAQEVVPQAVTGVKDEKDENGKGIFQSIDQSKLVPLLTAAIKELKAQNEDLLARVKVLESK